VRAGGITVRPSRIFAIVSNSSRLTALSFLFFLASVAAASPRIWFVNNGRASGDGSMAAPFNSLAAASAASAEGDVLYVFRGSVPYRESVTLRARQVLAGEGVDLTTYLNARGIAAPGSLPSIAVMPAIESGDGDAVTLANGSIVVGMTLQSNGGRALVAKDTGGDVRLDRVAASTIGGTAVAVEGGDAAIVFDASPVQAASGTAVSISGRTGGSVTFRNGSKITVVSGTKPGVWLRDNRGAFSFTDPLQLTTSGACALCVFASGQLAISSGTSAITTTGAPGIEISATAIDVYMKSVSVDVGVEKVGEKAAYGIALEDAPGKFRVDGGVVRNAHARGISVIRSSGVILQSVQLEKNAGDATATPACGSLLDDKELGCSAAIYLQGADGVTLKDVRIDGSGQAGIFGDRVSNLTLDGVTIVNAGNADGEHGVQIRELHGRSTIYHTTIKDSAARQLFVRNTEGEGMLEIRQSRFDGAPPPHGAQGMLVQLTGTAKFSLVVDDSDLIDNFSDAVHIVAEGKSNIDVVVSNSRFDRMASAVNVVVDREAQGKYRITGNTIANAQAAAINVSLTLLPGSISNGVIADNVIGRSGVAESGASCGSCSGIRLSAGRGGDAEATIRGNTIQQVDGSGIRVQTTAAASLRAAVVGNTIRQPHGAGVLNAISIQSGTRPADTAKLCIDVADNKIAGGWDPDGGGNAIAVTNKGSAAVSVAGFAGGDAAALAGHLRTRNNGAASTASGVTAAVSSCF
jgi:hypothetical protein